MKSHQFTSGAILLALLKFMLPVLFAMFLQSMYGAVAFLMRRFAGGSLFLIGLATPCSTLVQILMSFIAYFRIGRATGPAGDPEEA